MNYNLLMTRYHEESGLLLTHKYLTIIPLKVILLLLHIEKKDWQIYYEKPYRGLGNYILYHIDQYPELKPYITKTNCNFEFVYEYLTQYATLVKTDFSKANKPINKAIYYEEAACTSYKESWLITDASHLTSYTFFECCYTAPTSLSPHPKE